MKISEIISGNNITQRQIQPRAVTRAARVNKVVNNIAASAAQQEPTEIEKVLAMQKYAELERAADENYEKQLRSNLTTAKEFSKR